MAELVSTRDPSAEAVSYTDALIAGLAPDKGLYVPEGAVYPRFTLDEIGDMVGKPYDEVATIVKGRLIGDDIPLAEQVRMSKEAYDPAAFPEAVGGDITPITPIGNNLFTQNLALGPTGAFKDLPMRLLAQEVHYVLDELDMDMDDLGATSGDTGDSAMEAFKAAAMGRSRRVGMFIVSSSNGTMTPFQRAQMGLSAASDEYTHNLNFPGSFDDCQDLVKAVQQDSEFADLGAVNSINWGRISSQVIYHFYGYARMIQDGHIRLGDQIDTVTPTGNVGNVLSDHIARRMGLPVRRSVMATNENDVMHQLVRTGEYVEADKPHDTSSPSMDITKASNYERLVYEFFEGDAERTRAYMEEFERTGHVSLRDHGLSPSIFGRFGISSGSSNHADRLKAIQEVYNASGHIIDPHTADAVTIALEGNDGELAGVDLEVPTVCRETAIPTKCERTVEEALGFTPPRPAQFEGLEDMPGADTAVMIRSLDHLKAYLREHRHQTVAA